MRKKIHVLLFCFFMIANLSACKLDDPEYVDTLKKDYGIDVFEETFLDIKKDITDIKDAAGILGDVNEDDLSEEEIDDMMDQRKK